MRLHLFEFEDLNWFPDVIRQGGTDYLRYFLIRTELYKPCIRIIYNTLKLTGENKVLDLCSGGGGYVEQVYEGLNAIEKDLASITLTDKFPNTGAYELIKQRTGGKINYIADPVDVFAMSKDMPGLRVMFSAIHHFKPQEVKQILEETVRAGRPICIFDGGEKSIFTILGFLIVHPIAFALFTPFFRPFKISRLLFTYLLPLIPLYTICDGAISVLRMYSPNELLKIAESIPDSNYNWKSGKARNRFGIRATYLTGQPKQRV